MKLNYIKFRLRRFSRGVSNLTRWLPHIWNYSASHYDFGLSLFIESIKQQRDYIIKNKSNPFVSINSDYNISRMNLVIKLYDLTYGNTPSYIDYQVKSIENKYGKWSYEINDNTGVFGRKWDKDYSQEELIQVEQEYKDAISLGHIKIRKAKSLMWMIINENIDKWGF